jgi:hypothetical protein
MIENYLVNNVFLFASMIPLSGIVVLGFKYI